MRTSRMFFLTLLLFTPFLLLAGDGTSQGLFLDNFEVIFYVILTIAGVLGAGVKLKQWIEFIRKVVDAIATFRKSAEDDDWTIEEDAAFGKKVRLLISDRPFLSKKVSKKIAA